MLWYHWNFVTVTYSLFTETLSLDIDECELNNDLCGQVCENTDGSYLCTCEGGFQLVEGTSQCEGITA